MCGSWSGTWWGVKTAGMSPWMPPPFRRWEDPTNRLWSDTNREGEAFFKGRNTNQKSTEAGGHRLLRHAGDPEVPQRRPWPGTNIGLSRHAFLGNAAQDPICWEVATHKHLYGCKIFPWRFGISSPKMFVWMRISPVWGSFPWWTNIRMWTTSSQCDFKLSRWEAPWGRLKNVSVWVPFSHAMEVFWGKFILGSENHRFLSQWSGIKMQKADPVVPAQS